MQTAGYIGLSGIVFFVVFGFIWTGVLSLLAFLGGWRGLAKDYPAMGRIDGKMFRWCSARLSLFTNYSNCLTIIVSPSALYIRTNIFLRYAHNPLLIPREAIVDHSIQSSFFFRTAKLAIERKGLSDVTTITLYGRGLIDALDEWLGDDEDAESSQD